MDHLAELQALENISKDSWYAKDLDKKTIEYSGMIFERFLSQGSILELGPAEGVMTEILSKRHNNITVVEGSKSFSESIKNRFPNVKVIHSLFEDFRTTQTYDNIILGHVLEHVDDPVRILTLAKTWLAENGKIFAAVPNCRSLHRQAAVVMGLIKHERELNQTDLHHGHRRVYDPESFRSDFIAAGLNISIFGGYWLKPLSNGQLEEQWSEEILQTYMQLGERYPDIAAELYVIASK